MGHHENPRMVYTKLPEDGVCRFRARARREGGRGEGFRITVPAPITRGLQHVGLNIGSLVVVCIKTIRFDAYLRAANERQWVLGLPQTIDVTAGEVLDVEMTTSA